MAASVILEKACELIQIRVTPSQREAYRLASNGNISQWIRGAANEKLPVITKKALTRNPKR